MTHARDAAYNVCTVTTALYFCGGSFSLGKGALRALSLSFTSEKQLTKSSLCVKR